MKDKIIIFGTGQYWNNRKKYILNTCDIVCFLDNNPNKWNKKLCNKWINNPDSILNCDFDYVLIMCKSQDEIYKQLIRMGVSTQKIITYKQYKEIIIKEYYVKYGKKVNAHYDVICISTALNYNGGTMAVIYTVKALKSIGKKVLLCAEDCNEKLLDELINENIEILIAPSLSAVINDIIMSYIEDCEIVMVNVFQMLPVVCQLKGKKPVLWWIHEPEELYKPVLKEFSEYNNKALFDSVNIVAVSRIAQNNFNEYFYNCIKKTLAYSIPDILTKKEIKYEIQSKNNRIITFAIIGSIIERKAQDIFISAINQLSKEEIDELEIKNNEHPELREAHKALAREIITDLHGKEEYEKALKISECLFKGNIKELDTKDILVGFKDVPHFEVEENIKIIDLIVNGKVASSKREAREFINSGAIYINGDKVEDENMIITKDIALDNKILVIKRGKKKNYIGLIK